MLLNYDDCRDVFYHALMSALQEHSDSICKLHETEELWAISYDIIPWHPYIAIAFRIRSESDYPTSIVSAGWKHSEFIGEYNCESLLPPRNFAHQAYGSVADSPKQCQEVAHLIYLAAADALLDPGVAIHLQSLGIDAPVIGDTLPWNYFKYIVIDEDRVIQANYCDIVRANRVTRKLLGRVV